MLSLFNNDNTIGLARKHGRIADESGLNLRYPAISSQEISYDSKTKKYYLESFIREASLIDGLEAKIKYLDKDRFSKIKNESVKEISEEIQKIEEEFGQGSFEKMQRIKNHRTAGDSVARWTNNGIYLYLVGNGAGFYFGEKSRLPKLNNIKLMEGKDVGNSLKFLANSKIIKWEEFFYDNGLNFESVKDFQKAWPLIESNYPVHCMLEEWKDYGGLQTLRERKSFEKNINSNNPTYNVRTRGEFRNIFAAGDVLARDATNFYSVVTRGDIDIEIPENYSFETEAADKNYYRNLGTGDTHSQMGLGIWAEEQSRIDAFGHLHYLAPFFPNRYDIEGLSKLPKILSAEGNINIKCNSPDVFIVHEKAKDPTKKYNHFIHALSSKGRVKVKYDCKNGGKGK